MPAAHTVQEADPFTVLKVPAVHNEHDPPSPEYPGLQEQAELPTGESDPDGHVWHTESASAPSCPEYLPEVH